MPLHQKETVRGNLLDDIYVPADPSVSMPKYKIPDDEHDPRRAYAVIHDELMLDGNSRQNLATFCQTWAEPEVHKLMDESTHVPFGRRDVRAAVKQPAGRNRNWLSSGGSRPP